MKYIMLKHTLGESMIRKVPIIFPKELTHSDVFDSIRHMMVMKQNFSCEIHSAGFCTFGPSGVTCSGMSESLGVKSDIEDGPIITSYDYLHGIEDA